MRIRESIVGPAVCRGDEIGMGPACKPIKDDAAVFPNGWGEAPVRGDKIGVGPARGEGYIEI